MKKNLLSVVLMMFLSLSVSAQPGGGGGGGMGGGGGQGGGQRGEGGEGGGQSMQSVDLVGSTGLFDLDLKTVIKKTKVKAKKDPALYESVKQVIEQYQAANKATAEKFKEEFYLIKVIQKQIDAGADTKSLRSDMQTAMTAVRKIKAETIPTHKTLSDKMIMLLDAKQGTAWLKYYKTLCEKNTFSAVLKAENQGQKGQRSQGQSQGQGGGQRGQMGGF